MKAPAVDYVRPRTLTEAVDLLAHASVEARVIAGGQSLVAMMNLRVAAPGLLIDIARLPELLTVADHADADPRRMRYPRRDRGRSRCRSLAWPDAAGRLDP